MTFRIVLQPGSAAGTSGLSGLLRPGSASRTSSFATVAATAVASDSASSSGSSGTTRCTMPDSTSAAEPMPCDSAISAAWSTSP